MKKWKRILSAILAVLLLSGSMPVWAAETVDPDEQAGDIQELKEKLEGLIPEEELGKYTKKEPIGEARVEGETQDRSSFFAAVGSQATIRPGTPHAYGSEIRLMEWDCLVLHSIPDGYPFPSVR